MPEATAPLASRSPQSVAVDNLLRRELRIGDPADPGQIAEGLLARYPDAVDQMRREREGLNYGGPLLATSTPTGSAGASLTELALAKNDLERDIATLCQSSELKDIDVELKGWGRAVRRAASDGLAAAALALDIVQNDRAMAARRVLGDYARLARYVGSLSADTGPLFRRFAQSCDVMAALVLVGIGEGLAANGITRGTALIRVAASELQMRRNAVIQAFRTLTGTGLVPNGQDEFPRGLEAYRILTRQLEMSGQSDLRTLLDEASLAAELDQLVDLAVGANSSGLRELSTASMIVVDRLGRLVNACRAFDLPLGASIQPGTPDSPPMTYFASTLQLFVDAFTTTTGGRLLFIARPPIVAYGLYGMAGPDPATNRLIQLTLARGMVAEQSDCAACCGCDEDSIAREVMLDYVLYRIDRAIDFYAVGYQPQGESEPEVRAASLVCTLDAATTILNKPQNLNPALASGLTSVRTTLVAAIEPSEAEQLVDELLHKVQRTQTQGMLMLQELNSHYYAERQLEKLVQALCPRCFSTGFFSTAAQDSYVCQVIAGAMGALNGHPTAPGAIVIPPDMSSSLAAIAHNWPARRMGLA